MKKINHLMLLTLFTILIFINANIWVKLFAKIIYNGNTIPLNEVNLHTLQGTSIIAMLFILIICLTGTIISSMILVNVFFTLFYFANTMKFQSRGEVINFNEFSELLNIKELENISDINGLMIYLGIGLIIIIGFFILERYVYKRLSFKMFLMPRIITVMVIFGIILVTYKNTEYYSMKYFKIEENNSYVFNPIKEVKRVGFVPNFMMNISRDFMDKPKNYHKSKLEEIESKYTQLSKKYNKTKHHDITKEHTIIYLSESLWQQPSLIEGELPAPYIYELQNTYGGQMKSIFIGGGTANIEFEVLTSTSLEIQRKPQATSPYIEYFEKSKNHSSILTLVKQNAVIHPYTFSLYNRLDVYHKMDIKKVISEKEMTHPTKIKGSNRISDAYLNDELMSQVDQFNMINVMSMQNHSTYKPGILKDVAYQPKLKANILSDKPTKSEYGDYIEFANTYFRQLNQTDDAMHQFIQSINNKKENINLIVYGDHGPSFLRGKDQKLGNSIYHTPYFIYQNHNRNPKIKSNILNPMFLVPKLLSDGAYKVTPYYFLLTEMYKNNITGVTDKGAYINGELLKDTHLTLKQRTLVEDYRIISFNRFFDKNNINVAFFEKQY